MKKRITSLILAVAIAFSLVSAVPASAFLGAGGQGWRLDADGSLTISMNVGATNWKNAFSFQGLSFVKRLTVENGVTEIRSFGFWGCDQLATATIFHSVKVIGDSAFMNCSSLSEIRFESAAPPSVAPNAFEGIPAGARAVVPKTWGLAAGSIWNGFVIVIKCGDCGICIDCVPARYCPDCEKSLNNCTCAAIGWSVNSAGELRLKTDAGNANWVKHSSGDNWYAIRRQAVTLIIEPGVTNVADESFWFADKLTTASIPDSVVRIGNKAFSCTSLLESITIPDSVKIIDNGAFSSANNLKLVTLGNGVEKIGTAVFAMNTSLTSLKLPDSLKTIGEGAFYFCTKLTTMTIPDNVTSIGDLAFWDCVELRTVTIGKSVTEIGKEAFNNCKRLNSITFRSATPPTFGEDAFINTPALKTIYVPHGSKAAYEAVVALSKFNIVEICVSNADKCACSVCVCNCVNKVCHDCGACKNCNKCRIHTGECGEVCESPYCEAIVRCNSITCIICPCIWHVGMCGEVCQRATCEEIIVCRFLMCPICKLLCIEHSGSCGEICGNWGCGAIIVCDDSTCDICYPREIYICECGDCVICVVYVPSNCEACGKNPCDKECDLTYPLLGVLSLQATDEPTLSCALEILKFLSGMDSVIRTGGVVNERNLRAARISEKAFTGKNEPTISCALEILKNVVNIDSRVGKGKRVK